MKSPKFSILLLLVLIFALPAYSLIAFDNNYLKNFKWGQIIVSDKGYPEIDKCDMSMFKYKGGKFYIKGGKDATFNFMPLLKDGQTYGYYMNRLKKANAKKVKNIKSEEIIDYFYFSHDMDGKELYKTWPAKLSDWPKWEPSFKINTNAQGAENWICTAVSLKSLCGEAIEVKQWLANAKPGYMIYLVEAVSFKRDCPEKTYWDKTESKNITPVEDVHGEPIAACTIVVE